MARTSFYTVSFRHIDGSYVVSRFFTRLAPARNWAKIIRSGNYAIEVSIHAGPVGGDLIERWAA